MARCAICDKGAQFGKVVSHSRSQVSGRSNKMWKANIRSVRVNINGNTQKISICASCLKDLRRSEVQ